MSVLLLKLSLEGEELDQQAGSYSAEEDGGDEQEQELERESAEGEAGNNDDPEDGAL
jgi:hypothetical protein